MLLGVYPFHFAIKLLRYERYFTIDPLCFVSELFGTLRCSSRIVHLDVWDRRDKVELLLFKTLCSLTGISKITLWKLFVFRRNYNVVPSEKLHESSALSTNLSTTHRTNKTRVH